MYFSLSPLFLLVVVVTISIVDVATGQEATASSYCGSNTLWDGDSNECLCSNILEIEEDPNVISFGGIFDTTQNDWAPDVFEVAVKLINKGWWDALPVEEGLLRLEYSLHNSNCSESSATRAYHELRTTRRLNGLVGARCSGVSMSLARMSEGDNIAHVSPVSSSVRLSSSKYFPLFSRLVAPNDEHGEVGALITMIQYFGWDRVSIVTTNKDFAQDMVNEFQEAWKEVNGTSVAYYDSIRVTPDGDLDSESVQRALNGIPSQDRIVFLAAHSQHAFQILEQAAAMGALGDKIWVGQSSWVGRSTPDTDFKWLPSIPGYLGLALDQNREDPNNQHFLEELQKFQTARGDEEVLQELPPFAAETVDAIVALTKAIVATPPALRTDGAAVTRALRELDFFGVSGRVRFTPEGDRKNPQYMVLNAQHGGGDEGGGTTRWADIGKVGTTIGSMILDEGLQSVCFPKVGCGLERAPPASDPVPDPIPTYFWWILGLLVVFVLLFVTTALRYWRSHRSKEAFKRSVVNVRTADFNCIPTLVREGDDDVDVDVAQARTSASVVPSLLSAQWCWKETPARMRNHDSSSIVGDRTDCWIKYGKDGNAILEVAFQSNQEGCSPVPGYDVLFRTMEQNNVRTGFKREVQRIPVDMPIDQTESSDSSSSNQEVDLGKVRLVPALPRELKSEPQMVLVKGDVIQISKKGPAGFAFGTKVSLSWWSSISKLFASSWSSSQLIVLFLR